MSYQATHEKVLFQADPDAASTLRSIRDRIFQVSNSHLNRRVRVQTLDGHTYEGVIAHVDSGHVYLRIPSPPGQRAFFGPSDAAILTLVLFELLVIVLLA
ncbi:hypothetical protein [Cohnella hashimotonis]|uniref:Acetyl-CoA acetyltransferase n=1 Tax=Cohnella hashimotonis TaxID=2826895 RepID=A0ABT6TIU0_9BACL|nr:hypothetical protein [Cohnella hashimotonis]MDI4645864.1 hypothetical protein [Cohnella hashimotonis]